MPTVDRLVPIDGSKPLHHLNASVRQLGFMKQHCESLLTHLNVVMERTYSAAPLGRLNRGQTYELCRAERPDPTGERLLEKMTWMKWRAEALGATSSHFLANVCWFIQTFQMPLQGSNLDKRWGKVDLVGVTSQYLPVIIELKVDRGGDKQNDTPLHMLVEGVAYAIAFRKAWNEGCLRTEWLATMKKYGRDHEAARTLAEVPVVLLAPSSFWRRAVGVPGKRSNGKVKEDAWKPFSALVQAFKDYGFPVCFAQLGIETDGNRTVKVTDVSPILLF